jgi:hypothetical protein
VTEKEVRALIGIRHLLDPNKEATTRLDHMRRIAWFVVNGWRDPIEIDFGVPCFGYEPTWPIIDGNHRLAAAILREDHSIVASCSGQVDVIDLYRP